MTYSVYQAASDPNGVAALFFIVKVALDGTVYGAYSNGQHVYLISSTDKGQTWSAPVQVDHGPKTLTSMFPALAVGTAKGSVAVGWYGTPDKTDDDNADWRVFVAQTFDALDKSPQFTCQQVSDHAIHSSNISLGGTFGTANRNLLDYFQLCYDPSGALLVAYTDDHNDFSGNVYVTRQQSGMGMTGAPIPSAKEGPNVPPLQPYSPDGAQVVASGAVFEGLLVSIPDQDPLGIQEIRYSSSKTSTGDIMLTAAMKVSSLANVTPESTWRMNFAANCAGTALSPTKQFTLGSSDRGNGFFLEAQTDQQGNKTYSYGTVVRNSDGSLTDTIIGSADMGTFDPTTNTITVGVLVSKLNALLPAGAPPIQSGTELAGLRGSAESSASGDVRESRTRGGLEYKLP